MSNSLFSLSYFLHINACAKTAPKSEFHRIVLHNTGCTLGFSHEHMRLERFRVISKSKSITNPVNDLNRVRASSVTHRFDSVIRQTTKPHRGTGSQLASAQVYPLKTII